jgi:hypothetical protein
MEDEEIIESLRKYLEEKKKLDLESCYFLTKKLNEVYWEEVKGDDSAEEEDEVDDDIDVLDESETEEEIAGGFEDGKETKKGIINRPQIKIKK